MSVVPSKEDQTSLSPKLLLASLQKERDQLPPSMVKVIPDSHLENITKILIKDDRVFQFVDGLEKEQRRLELEFKAKTEELDLELDNEYKKVEAKQDELRSKYSNLAYIESLNEKMANDADIKYCNQLEVIQKQFISELDEQVRATQEKLGELGLPGFFITSDPEELKLQMCLSQMLKSLLDQHGKS